MVKIKISLGTAIVLGLIQGKIKVPFTTLYLMVGDKCISNCAFCTQSIEAQKREMLSRVTWYEFPLDVIAKSIEGKTFSRICFQTLDYPEIVDHMLEILPTFVKFNYPISVSIAPPLKGKIEDLAEYVDTVSIALDAANEEIFKKTKGSLRGNRFTWENHWNELLNAKKHFKNVNTHIIVGLGETDKDIINVMLKLRDNNITTALFAFTPVLSYGTAPPISRYRMIQLSRCLIYDYKATIDDFIFDINGNIERIVSKDFEKAVENGRCFMTSGCPGCNRPFYNEEPKRIYNYPYSPDRNELFEIKKQLVKIK